VGRPKKQDSKLSFFSSLKKETLEAVISIIFVVVGIFLIFAAFNNAGFLGRLTFDKFSFLFGIGYYILPLILLFLGITSLSSLQDHKTSFKSIGGIVIFISCLGILDLLFKESGGFIGKIISNPIKSLFGFWMSLIVLIAVLLIFILILFNLSIKFDFKKIFRRDEDQNKEDIEIKGLEENTKDNDEEEIEDEDENEEEEEEEGKEKDEELEREVSEKKQNPSGLIFFSRRTKQKFTPPPLSLLEKDSGKPEVGDIKANANIIKRTLANFGIRVEMDEVSIGPSITRYALKPAEGVKLSRIVALQNDLSLALAAHPLRIEAPIPGKSLVGIEIPNTTKTIVGLGSLLRDPSFQDPTKPLNICIGKGITGKSTFANFAKMPHALIAGATGSGKSVTIHAIITSLLYRNHPDQLKFIMIDPKRVELTLYNKIPHLLTPVITDPKKTILALKWAAKEMSRRYDILEERSVRDIQSYHTNILEPALKLAEKRPDAEIPESMPFIIIVIDELADIMQAYPRELEAGIVRLAQMSRAVGIHLLISTQRPSVNVITGLIKANIPARVALQVSSQIDSRTILDTIGAEKLLGAGDMLFLSGEMSQPRRLQSAFITEKEVKKVVDWLHKHYKDEIDYNEQIDFTGNSGHGPMDEIERAGGFDDNNDEDEDELYEEAKKIVLEAKKASTSYIQRKLRVGYARAARLIDILEEKGVVGPADGSKPREILIRSEERKSNNQEYKDNEYNDSEDERN
jgi:DNA segregation ATPase FtsK/SpoIIIE, S-DNA-T family